MYLSREKDYRDDSRGGDSEGLGCPERDRWSDRMSSRPGTGVRRGVIFVETQGTCNRAVPHPGGLGSPRPFQTPDPARKASDRHVTQVRDGESGNGPTTAPPGPGVGVTRTVTGSDDGGVETEGRDRTNQPVDRSPYRVRPPERGVCHHSTFVTVQVETLPRPRVK